MLHRLLAHLYTRATGRPYWTVVRLSDTLGRPAREERPTLQAQP